MPIALPAALAIAGGTVAGAYISSKSAGKAADAQRDAANQASDLQWKQYQQTREDQAPWREAGTTALSQLTSGLAPGGQFTKTFGMGDFQADPGYQFRLDEGMRGIESAATARGARYSGATLKALNRFNSNQASQEYGNAYNRFNNDQSTQYNRLAGLAGVGQTATNQLQSAGQAYATQAGQAIQNAGTARASGYVGAGNAINGAIGQLGNYYALSSLLPTTGVASGTVANVLY